ncbi:MAG: sugar ABC transporter substrate-binding protein [Calditrichaeota bacterium]|nr:MAG: sugar ABC transporter substrate-binding protein [Calditrichota bacterium]
MKFQKLGFLVSILAFTILLGCDKSDSSHFTHKMALVMKASSNPFFARMEKGARQAADSFRVQLLIGTITRETDINQQVSIIENMIVQGVAAILIAPADSKAIVNVLKKAQAAGIRIINIDNRIDAATAEAVGLTIDCYVGVDNATGGKMAGDYLATLMEKKGKAAMLEGIRGVDNAEARKRGFLQAIESTKIEVVASQSANWAQDQGLDVFANILQANPDITGLFCANDMMALGAIQAIEQAGKTGKIYVASYDNLEAAQEAISQGRLHATIEQHPERMGFEGVAVANALLNGEQIDSEMMIELDLITKENL